MSAVRPDRGTDQASQMRLLHEPAPSARRELVRGFDLGRTQTFRVAATRACEALLSADQSKPQRGSLKVNRGSNSAIGLGLRWGCFPTAARSPLNSAKAGSRSEDGPSAATFSRCLLNA